MKPWGKLLVLTCWLGYGLTAARAQTLITSISTSTTDTADTISEGFTFENTRISLATFSTAISTYAATSLADAAFVRRNTGVGNANQSSLWYANGTAPDMLGTHATNYASLLLDNNISGGSDNTFANGTTAQDGNIERLDFVYSGGLVANSKLGFAVFERGAVSVHDAFKIAVITGWDSGTNQPTAYGNLVGQAQNWGPTNVAATFGYTLFRYNNGDNITVNTASTETGSQGLGGVYFTMADLGIAPGTTIYGYSLFGYDVSNGGSSANLLDWNNTTYYPSNTTNATGTGGIDLATINGVAFTAVPEPQVSALAGVGLMAGAALWQRRRRHRPY